MASTTEAIASNRASTRGYSAGIRSFTFLVLFFVAICAAVRMIHISDRALWLDEAYSAWFSAATWHDLWSVVPTYEPHPPFYYSLLKLWRMVAGDSGASLRALSLLLSVITVPVMLQAAREQQRIEGGIAPARLVTVGTLAALCPMFVQEGQEARPYALFILAYAVAILGLLRLLRDFKANNKTGSLAGWWRLGVGTEATLWSHAVGLLYAASLFFCLLMSILLFERDRGRVIRCTITVAAVALAYLPCLMLMLGRVGDWSDGWLKWSPVMLIQLPFLYIALTDTVSTFALPAIAVTLLVVIRGVRAAFPPLPWRPAPALLILVFLPAVLETAISIFVMPVFLIRTLTPTLVPLSLLMGTALATSQAKFDRVVLYLAILVSVLIGGLQMAFRPPTERWNEVTAYLASHLTVRDQVWLFPNDVQLPLGVAMRNARSSFPARPLPAAYPAVGYPGPVRGGSPAVVSLTPGEALAIAESPEARNAPTVWLVTRKYDLFDPGHDLVRALSSNRTAGTARRWGPIEVQPFTLRSTTSLSR